MKYTDKLYFNSSYQIKKKNSFNGSRVISPVPVEEES
jgi:hypothetical protein